MKASDDVFIEFGHVSCDRQSDARAPDGIALAVWEHRVTFRMSSSPATNWTEPVGTITMSGISYKHGDTPATVRRHPPMLGEHTDEVLRELGVDDEEIAALRREGAI